MDKEALCYDVRQEFDSCLLGDAFRGMKYCKLCMSVSGFVSLCEGQQPQALYKDGIFEDKALELLPSFGLR